MMLALSVICMVLGSVIESSTLFLLAAASFFVGIICREFGMKTGCAFYAAGILLGLLLAPNKLYVLTYSAMGFYILAVEIAWRLLGKSYAASGTAYKQESVDGWIAGDTEGNVSGVAGGQIRNHKILFWLIKYAVFNVLYIPAVFGFQKMLFGQNLSTGILLTVFLTGQAAIYIYDRAYEYVQATVWNKMRGKLFG